MNLYKKSDIEYTDLEKSILNELNNDKKLTILRAIEDANIDWTNIIQTEPMIKYRVKLFKDYSKIMREVKEKRDKILKQTIGA